MDKPQPKKPNILLRLALGLLTLAVLLAGIAVVVFRDRLNLDEFKRWYTYRSLTLNDSGQAESFLYSGQDRDVFADLDGDLLVCGKNAIGLYSGSGAQYIDQPVSFASPAAHSAGGAAVVYDAGGNDLYVFRRREQAFFLHSGDMLVSARLNDSGLLTVVTQQAGYRGVVTVYDADYHPAAALSLSSVYVMDATVSDDGGTLCVASVFQADGEFTSSLLLYNLAQLAGDGVSRDAVPFASCPLDGSLVLELGSDTGCWWALGDRGVWVLDAQGTALGRQDWSDRILKACSLSGDGFAAVLLGRYRTGSQSTLSIIDSGGALAGSLDLDEQVMSISAAGRYLAVLTADRLDIYTRELQLYSSLSGTQGAQKVLLHRDGSAMLVSSGTARLYVPG